LPLKTQTNVDLLAYSGKMRWWDLRFSNGKIFIFYLGGF